MIHHRNMPDFETCVTVSLQQSDREPRIQLQMLLIQKTDNRFHPVGFSRLDPTLHNLHLHPSIPTVVIAGS